MKKLCISMILLSFSFGSYASDNLINSKTSEITVENTISGTILTIVSALDKKLVGLSKEEKENYYAFKDQINKRLQTDSIIQKINFKTNNTDIKDTVVNYLTNLILSLDDYKSLKFTLNGYSDARGTIDYNLKLAENRIISVEKILLLIGVPSDNILKNNYGESKSEENKSLEDYFFDRKVEIIITK